MDSLAYYLIKFQLQGTYTEDFEKVTALCKALNNATVTVVSDEEIVVELLETTKVRLSVAPFRIGQDDGKQCAIAVYTQLGDSINATSFLQFVAGRLEYKLFNPALGCFLPKDDSLVDVSLLTLPEKLIEVFRAKELEPLFRYGSTHMYYAKSLSDGSIHIVNPGMLEYFEKFGVLAGEKTEEFSYQVAKNLQIFVAKHDFHLIPENFYEYLNRQQRIINYSFIDMWNVNRKIFIQPLVLAYNPTKQTFDEVTAQTAAFNKADKILAGENLDRALNRMVSEWMNLAETYDFALVSRAVRFDRDRHDILTPSLTVLIFFEKPITLKPVGLAGRSWTSVKDVVN